MEAKVRPEKGPVREITLIPTNDDEHMLLEAIASVMEDGGEIRVLANNQFIYDMEMRFGEPK